MLVKFKPIPVCILPHLPHKFGICNGEQIMYNCRRGWKHDCLSVLVFSYQLLLFLNGFCPYRLRRYKFFQLPICFEMLMLRLLDVWNERGFCVRCLTVPCSFLSVAYVNPSIVFLMIQENFQPLWYLYLLLQINFVLNIWTNFFSTWSSSWNYSTSVIWTPAEFDVHFHFIIYQRSTAICWMLITNFFESSTYTFFGWTRNWTYFHTICKMLIITTLFIKMWGADKYCPYSTCFISIMAARTES